MANILPHIEDSSLTTYIEPKGEYTVFENEEHYAKKGREWGLFAKTVKKEFWYKGKTYQRLVTIKGYEKYGKTEEFNTLVIEFQDGNLTCINPAFLKEMQSPNFGKEQLFGVEDSGEEKIQKEEVKEEKPIKEKPKKEPKKKEEKPKKEKLELPTEKVKFTAKVKEFAEKYNAFTQENDEVVLYEEVKIQSEPILEIGLAWSGLSNTLKKLELSPGEEISFEAKIVEKKFNKEILYKINNPSKIVKR
jgi:hypothetical protein